MKGAQVSCAHSLVFALEITDEVFANSGYCVLGCCSLSQMNKGEFRSTLGNTRISSRNPPPMIGLCVSECEGSVWGPAPGPVLEDSSGSQSTPGPGACFSVRMKSQEQGRHPRCYEAASW